jgi:radical SAM family protein
MELLCLATSGYDDPWAAEWHPDLRWTVTYLRRNGVDTGYTYLAAPRDPAGVLDRWTADPPGAVFVEVTEENQGAVLRFLAALRPYWPQTVQVVGGIPATLDGAALLAGSPHLDGCVAGERDRTLVELADRLRTAGGGHRGVLRGLAGLRTAGAPPLPRPLLPDLDALGPMATDGVGELLAGQPAGERVGYVKASRGCYARCTFCGVPDVYRWSGGRGWRARSPARVVDDVERLVSGYGTHRFVFQDDNFVGPGEAGQERVRAIAREIRDRDLRIEFAMCCTLGALRGPTLELLQVAGLRRVGMSIESVNPESLALLGKGHRAEHVYPKLRMLEELGLACEVNLIFFDPYTTLAGVRRNLELLAYVRDSRHLAYSDAFPFNELRVFSWSRVRSRLLADGRLLAGDRWRYTDPAVARLAAFVSALQARTGMVFKRRLLFAPPDANAPPASREAVLRLAGGLRHWVGLTLLPRYVADACDVLERAAGDEAERELAGLAVRFERDLSPLWTLQGLLAGPVTAGRERGAAHR